MAANNRIAETGSLSTLSLSPSCEVSPAADGGAGGGMLLQKDMTFMVSPPELNFHAFKPHHRYEATLMLQNQTKTSKDIRIIPPESRFFSISEPRGGANSLKMAAGLCVSYTIYFKPEEDIDYECDLVAITEYEKFIIPVRAVGSRGRLSFPNVVNFENCPIKATSTTTVLLSNVGTKPCEWRAKTSQPFAITPQCGRIEPQQAMQVTVEFLPTQLMHYESSVVFDLGSGDLQHMKVSGECAELSIVMDMQQLIIQKTFISLERQGIVKVTNNGGTAVKYCWKAHRTLEDEVSARSANVEMLMIDGTISKSCSIGKPADSMSNARLARTTRSNLESKQMIFNDDVFTIDPIQGTIPARGSREFVVTFNPQIAMTYLSTAFLDIEGKADRMPLVLKSIGLGPQCMLSFDSLDLGDIFINSMHQYEVILENRGSIDAKFALLPQMSLFGPKFKFSPNAGIIAAGTTQTIEITFCSDIIGIVSETFKIHVQGSRDDLTLHFKGRVIGPTFHFDVEELDFGNVSYNFWHVKNFHLVNTSEIPMRFHLRVPEDQPTRKEFDVIPSTGTILPHGKQKIQLDFLSNTVQEYNAHLVVDIDEVGDNLDSLPIKATCIVPDLVVSRDAMDYGQCFIGYPYSLDVELKNETALSAKYEFILPSDDDPIRKKADIVIGSGDVKERKGIVHARSSSKIQVTLTAKMIGGVHVPLFVRVLGSDRVPHHIAVSARVTGPKVEVMPKTLEFGSTEVLTEVVKSIVIANNSPIPAVFTAKLLGKHASNVLPPFTLKVTEGVIKPNSTAPLHVAAYLDEAMKFSDDLVINVQNNTEAEQVQLTATGKGYTIVPSIPMDVVDFSDLFTTVPVKRVFTLYNKGRRPQQIQWQNERGKVKEGEPPVVFTITPERATINGKSEETFTIEGLSETKGLFTESFVCKMSQSHKTIFKAKLQGNFQPPLLQYSSTSLQFAYTYNTDSTQQHFMSTKPLTMKNVSPLDLTFSLKIAKANATANNSDPLPFFVDQTDFTLKKGESAAVTITFDAAYRGDRISHKTGAKLTISFANHGQKDTINLVGELAYPNLTLDNAQVDFGCILNDTEQRKVLSITNHSAVAASYTWVFEEETRGDSRKSIKPGTASSTDSAANVPINNVFDIIPFRGIIAPGATERAEFLFSGIPGKRFTASAVCQVEGGPDYSVQLVGEASSIHFKFDKVNLDFGSQEYDKWEEREITITNSGRVPFPFQADLSCLARPGMVDVVPMSGVVKDKAKIIVRFSPRVPDRVDDNFKIQVAHFDPQLINVRGMGLYSSIVISAATTGAYVSRNDPPVFKNYLVEGKQRAADSSLRSFSTSAAAKAAEAVVDPALSEAERLYFRDIITEDALMIKAIAAGEATENIERSQQIKRKTFAGDQVKYILSRYVMDMGNVVKGDSRRKSFKITNTSTNPITFTVDRKSLLQSPVSLNPDKFNKLAAYASQVVEVTINTKDKAVGVGNVAYEVIVDIKGGPLVLLEVRAFVVVPQLEVSEEALDFGTVLVGMTRMMPIIIENTQVLPCEWNAIYPDFVEQQKKKNEKHGRFVCKPEKGILQPRQKAVIEVSFIPLVKEALNHRVQLKMANNPKVLDIVCNGVGDALDVQVQPPLIELPPVFPSQVTRQAFSIVNNNDIPVEIFCYDFDEKYLVEEDILRHAPEHFEDDVLLLPPREVGAALPDYLMEAYFNKLLEIDNNLGSLDVFPNSDDLFVPAPELEQPQIAQPSQPMPPLDGAADAAAAAASTSDALRTTASSGKPMVVVMVGPPLSGKTSHAKMIASQYDLAPLNIDSAAALMMELDTPEGATLRSLYSHINSKSTPRPEATAAQLSAVLRWRLRNTECAAGVVVDDLVCSLTSNSELFLNALRDTTQMMGLQLIVVSLAMSEATIQLRRAIMAHQQAEADLEKATLHPLSEIEYERLDEPSRKAHDLKLKHFRDCKRRITKTSDAVAAIEKQFEAATAEKPLTTVQEDLEKEITDAIQAEEEKKNTKKAPPPKKGAAPPPDATTTQVQLPWHELDSFQRFKKLHLILKPLPEDVYKTVLCDRAESETASAICLVMPELSQSAKEAASAKALAEANLVKHTELVIPDPVTRVRIERITERRVVKPVKNFKILTSVVKEVVAVAGKDKKPAKGGAPAAAQTQEVMEEVTRWIVQPHTSLDVVLQFCTEDPNSYEQVLRLGVVGSPQEFSFTARVTAAYPEMHRDPKNMFVKKIKAPQDSGSRLPVKTFIISKRAFEFGPLLIAPAAGVAAAGKAAKPDPKAKGAGAALPETQYTGKPSVANNSDKIRFQNNGLFPAEFTLAFENDKDKVFKIDPDTLTLPPGEGSEVTLHASPDVLGDIKNNLVVCVKDNPEPFFVDVNCIGARPELSVDGKKDVTVDFGRMMLKRSEAKTLTLRNESVLPLKWKLIGADRLPPELTIDVTSGSLDVKATVPLTVSFLSERSNAFNIPLKIEVSDFDQSALYEIIPFTLKAEAHDVIVEWTKELDFKTIRVGEVKKETIKLLNKGPYEVGFMFRLPRRLQELVTITPAEGTLRGMTGFKDAAIMQVEVAFRAVDKEVQITKKFGDIEASFFDPSAKELVYPVQNISVKGEALYNKFVIKPAHINFGPCLYKQKKQATFDVQNTGCFEIKYRLFSFKDGLGKALEAPVEPAPGKKPDKKPAKKDKTEDVVELQLGAFAISPPVGVIPVGGSTTFTASINPDGSAHFHEVLGIHIEDRDPSTNKDGIPFDLEAESCVPGIVADLDAPEADSIFEEQQIVSRFDQFRKVQNVFAREDRVFSYGICLSGRRSAERFRLTNPFKIPCTVTVQVIPRGDAPDAKAAAEAFDVQKIEGGKLIIPPHENRYVTVGFTPNNLGTFSAFLEATVEGGVDPKTKQLRFELRGEGSLPNIAVEIPPPPPKVTEAPAAVDPKAAKGAKPAAGGKADKNKDAEEKQPPNLLFMPRTIVGTRCNRVITVRNVGDLTATIRFACPSSQNRMFSFPARGEDITLLPGAVEKYSVFFEPNTAGEFSGKLIMSLSDNHYEDTIISLVGEGYVDPFAFEGVDEFTENRLTIGDVYVGEPKKKTFAVKSYHLGLMRFKWTCPAGGTIDVSPSVGHMSPGVTRTFEATFCGNAPSAELAKCVLTCTSIAFSDSMEVPRVDWDNNATFAKWVPDDVKEDASNDEYAMLRRPLRKLVEPIPEPEHAVTADVNATKDLFVQYTCDHTQYEVVLPENCVAAKAIDFSCTKIFQQRTVSFSLKNTGKVQLPFSFTVARLSGDDENSDADDGDDHNDVFTIFPENGVVPPGGLQDVKVVFKPLAVATFRRTLVASLPYGNKPEHLIPLSGLSECPLVHFELPQSNYLLTRTEGDALTVDPDSCVVQFFSRGIKIRNSLKFMVLNPSNMSYDFEWEDVASKDGTGAISPFKCLTQRGTIHSGKKLEMVFEFTPESLKVKEAVWKFHIGDQVVIPFLLVGQASEPEVYFSQNKLQFGQVIVGGKSKQTVTIENRENVSYPFAFEKVGSSVVHISPLSGSVPPNGSVTVDVTFSPTAEESYNTMLVCKVKKVIAPLTVNVKGEGYTTHDSLRVQAPDGSTLQLSATQTNVINLGAVQVNSKASRKITLSNQGRFNLDYRWSLPTNPAVTLSQMIGTVVPNTDASIELCYAPSKEEALAAIKLQCKVTNGSTYTVLVSANAAHPNIIMNWKSFDFGPHFLSSVATGEAPPTATLTLTNKDKTLVAVDALFDNKEHLEIDATSFVIAPGERRDVRVQFTPKDTIAYSETLNFLLNGLTTVSATITGEGVAPKVEILNRQIRFGTLRVGDKKEIEVKLQCKSKIATPIAFDKTIEAELAKLGLSIAPDNSVFLKPKEIKSVMLTFRPPLRMRPFSNDLKFVVCGQELPFVNVSGSCQGAEVHVDNKTVQFGTVVAGTRVTKKVVIMNTGDLQLNFNWNERKLDKDFSMNPVTGLIAPHSEQVCELTYHPPEANRDGKRDIEVRFDDAPTLSIGVFGNSVDRPALTDSVSFNCRVRETNTQKISIKNDSAEPWVIRPAIDNNVWSGPETFTIRARESGEYAITYAPQTCTKNRPNAATDQGTVFFPLPTGNALLYRLEGSSDPPSVAAPPVEREVVAKAQHLEKLIVTNWLKVPQRFNVTMQWTHDPNDESVVVKGVSAIDVPPNATREYKLNFLSYKEGKFTGTVNFTNEDTHEYQFYNLAFTAKAPKESAAVNLVTQVRSRAVQEVSLANPLAKSVTVNAKCDNPEVVFPASVVIPAKTTVKVPVEFFPLVVKEYPPAKLVFTAAELGDFPFAVTLNGQAPAPEKAVRVNCSLGQSISTTLRFLHYSKAAVDFTFKFQDPKQTSFIKSNGQMVVKVNPCVDVRAGQEVSVDVTFEPSRLGEFKETIEMTSPLAGSYVFPIYGTCTAPQRQGPFEIRPNQNTTIPFKNVFAENITFTFATDSPNFVVAKPSEVIPSKKPTAVVVTYKCDDPNAVVRGKLTITGTSAADPTPVQWVYYLRGMKESEALAAGAPPAAAAKGKK